MAVGLAVLVPMMSLATWRQPGSKRAYSYNTTIMMICNLDKVSKTYASDVATRNNARSANESSADVGDDRTIQVGHDHHIELLGTSNKLHGPIATR